MGTSQIKSSTPVLGKFFSTPPPLLASVYNPYEDTSQVSGKLGKWDTDAFVHVFMPNCLGGLGAFSLGFFA